VLRPHEVNRRVQELLRSNDSPSHAEEDEFANAREHVRTRIKEIDERMANIRSELLLLEEEKTELVSTLGKANIILHPLRSGRMAPEILQEIFLACRRVKMNDMEMENSLHPSWVP
jgi:hypothetical protein